MRATHFRYVRSPDGIGGFVAEELVPLISQLWENIPVIDMVERTADNPGGPMKRFATPITEQQMQEISWTLGKPRWM